jgi:cystathionine beta-lyase
LVLRDFGPGSSASHSASAEHPFDEVTLEELRHRQSAKWQVYGPGVLPAWIAEMDYPLAPPIRAALHEAIELGDSGYAFTGSLGVAFSEWAEGRWGWAPHASDIRLVVDVVSGIGEVLKVATAPGDRVLIEPPVYPPFALTIQRLRRVVANAPLLRSVSGTESAAGAGWAADLDAIERAYQSGVRAHILCSPHNPTGHVYSRAELERIGELAARHHVLVLADEVHAPLTLPGSSHVPFPCVSEAAAAQAVVLTSASKTWNLAGFKAALLIACGEEPRRLLAELPSDLPFRAGIQGVLAGRAAFRDGEPWRAQVLSILDRNRRLLADLMMKHLPQVRYTPPRASYLAWLDFRALGLGPDPARRLLERGRIALSSGPSFGVEGQGFARLNIGTTRGLLEQAVEQMAAAVRE